MTNICNCGTVEEAMVKAAEITEELREIVLDKEKDGKCGLWLLQVTIAMQYQILDAVRNSGYSMAEIARDHTYIGQQVAAAMIKMKTDELLDGSEETKH